MQLSSFLVPRDSESQVALCDRKSGKNFLRKLGSEQPMRWGRRSKSFDPQSGSLIYFGRLSLHEWNVLFAPMNRLRIDLVFKPVNPLYSHESAPSQRLAGWGLTHPMSFFPRSPLSTSKPCCSLSFAKVQFDP
jgi:hypothetical protein